MSVFLEMAEDFVKKLKLGKVDKVRQFTKVLFMLMLCLFEMMFACWRKVVSLRSALLCLESESHVWWRASFR